MRIAFLTFALLIAGLSGVQAQKFGYVNSQAIIAEMNEFKAAESDLVAFRDQKQKLLQTKMEAAQAEYQTLLQKQQAGELTPKQLQEGEASLQKKQQELAELEATIQQDVAKRREEKFQPVFDKVNDAIAGVAKEDGYLYVFDASAGGAIVYADESMDITEKVKTKLSAMN